MVSSCLPWDAPFPRMLRACGQNQAPYSARYHLLQKIAARRSATVRAASLEIKVWMLKTEVLETVMYAWVTWSPNADHYSNNRLRTRCHRFLLPCFCFRQKQKK